jgi:hypothetical protein
VVLTADLSERPGTWRLVTTIPFGEDARELGLVTDVHRTPIPYVPRSFAVGSDGSFWILDVVKKRLAHYSADGRYLGQVGGFKFDRFSPLPRDVVFSNGRIYVLEENQPPSSNLVTVSASGTLSRTHPLDEGHAVTLSLLYPSAEGIASLFGGWAEPLGVGPRGVAGYDPPASNVAQFLPGVPLPAGGWIAMDAPSDQDVEVAFIGVDRRAVQPVHLKVLAGTAGRTKEVPAVTGPILEAVEESRVAIYIRISPAEPEDAERFGGGVWLLDIGGRGPVVWERLPEGEIDDEGQVRHLAAGPDGRLYLMVPTREGERIYSR